MKLVSYVPPPNRLPTSTCIARYACLCCCHTTKLLIRACLDNTDTLRSPPASATHSSCAHVSDNLAASIQMLRDWPKAQRTEFNFPLPPARYCATGTTTLITLSLAGRQAGRRRKDRREKLSCVDDCLLSRTLPTSPKTPVMQIIEARLCPR